MLHIHVEFLEPWWSPFRRQGSACPNTTCRNSGASLCRATVRPTTHSILPRTRRHLDGQRLTMPLRRPQGMHRTTTPRGTPSPPQRIRLAMSPQSRHPRCCLGTHQLVRLPIHRRALAMPAMDQPKRRLKGTGMSRFRPQTPISVPCLIPFGPQPASCVNLPCLVHVPSAFPCTQFLWCPRGCPGGGVSTAIPS